MKINLRLLLSLGILVEVLIFALCYVMQPSLEETFRYAARYSGRLSFGVFLMSFYFFAFSQPIPMKENRPLRNWLTLFAVVHLIHFGFLATNVYLNEIPIVVVKLTGGALAYFMIVFAPLVLHKLKLFWQLVYFYYVSVVMAITYLTRVKGDFEGATPYWFHYFALGLMAICMLVFGWRMWKSKA